VTTRRCRAYFEAQGPVVRRTVLLGAVRVVNDPMIPVGAKWGPPGGQRSRAPLGAASLKRRPTPSLRMGS